MYMYSDLFNSGFHFTTEADTVEKKQPSTSRTTSSSLRSSWPPSRSQSRSQSVAPSRRSSSYNLLSPSSLELASLFEFSPTGDLWFTLKAHRTSSTRRKSPRSSTSQNQNNPEGHLTSFLSLDLAEGSSSIRSQSRAQKRVNTSGAALRAHRTFNKKFPPASTNPVGRKSSYLPPRAKPLPASSGTLPPTPVQHSKPTFLSPVDAKFNLWELSHHRRKSSNLTYLTASTAISPSVKMTNRVHTLAVLEGKRGVSNSKKAEPSSFWDEDEDEDADVDTLLGDAASSVASPATPPAPTCLPLPTPTPLQPVSVNIPSSCTTAVNNSPVAMSISNSNKRQSKKSANSSEFQFEFENSLEAELWKRLISVS